MRPLPLMLFAAGFGARMGALTAHRPKPLIEAAGKPLIDHALHLAEEAGISKIVVNLHYLGEQIADHLQHRNLILSWERDQILETGGGLKAALPLLGDGPVLTLNTDAVWSGENPLIQLLNAWNPAKMDALLLLLPAENALGHSGIGDFFLDDQDRISRANGNSAPVYLGAQILKTQGLSAISEPVFSLNRLWDIAIANQRAYGLIHKGGWCDVGRPEGIALAETLHV
ncbi:MAG: nucleotidyltransferase family protein [Cypionkella sp.]|uniref:nucleotidyltransferase family protein n=1 Tax=Cypionkella sp. TaxID=2811411 RepID=UPI002AB8D1D0|nr:nucleotidyltransferase family protein [Cypionkella sp.]MDZ4312250.1 nucleotidyltransferase family protein [Cypionkella sp.]MDZ4393819.1 nucleotidyltransferase family protein [Cypionkella sp.]